MARSIRLKSPDATRLMAVMQEEIESTFKAFAAAEAAKAKLKDPKTFYWRGNNPAAARSVSNIPSIPPGTLVPLPSYIAVADKSGVNNAHLVAMRFTQMFARAAPRITGRYATSIRYLLNGRVKALSTIMEIGNKNLLRPGETITIYSDAVYATKLESDYYRRDREGIWRKITKALIAEFAGQASIKYITVSGAKLNAGFVLNTTVLVIGSKGQFGSGIASKTGQAAARRKRKKTREANKRKRLN
jgi:hypothetical protein